MIEGGRFRAELKTIVARRHLREVNYSFGATTAKDVLTALRTATQGQAIVEALERAFVKHLGVPYAVTFGSGRGALYATLRGLRVGPGDEVAVPGFTCVVVPAAVVLAGATPRYVDIDPETFNLNVAALPSGSASRCRVAVAQHTFGTPLPVGELRAAMRPGTAIIEDCAHTTGGNSGPVRLGRDGDAAIFSFELTKPLSAGSGGVAVTPHADIAAALREQQRSAEVRGCLSSSIQLGVSWLLYHPWLYGAGKFALAAFYKSGLLPVSISTAERAGARPVQYPGALAPPLAAAALSILRRVEQDDARRRAAARRYAAVLASHGFPWPAYDAEVAYVRFPLLVRNRRRAAAALRRHQIEVGEWFNSPLHPAGCPLERFGYVQGTCPVAERLAQHIINLPTHPRMSQSDVDRVCEVLDHLAQNGELCTVEELFSGRAGTSREQ